MPIEFEKYFVGCRHQVEVLERVMLTESLTPKQLNEHLLPLRGR